MFDIVFICLIVFSNLDLSTTAPYYQCDDPIFCHGKVLQTVQLLRIFRHSKSFVDLRMLNTPDVILQNFDIFMFKNAHKPSPNSVKKFLRENFGEGDELDTWLPQDFRSNPSWLQKIKDTRMRKFAFDLLQVIPKLTRKVRQNVLDHPIHYSFIAVPHGFVVPGGTNKESYYLDSYWIIKGLLINDMTTTVKGILDNFILMERKYGYIPRGTRIYYCNNWQPPVLAILADLYMQKTNDIYWLQKNIDTFDHELRHWLNYRCFELTRDGEVYTLARYTNSNTSPRPDRYNKDFYECRQFKDTEKILDCYTNIKAPGGAGWYYPKRYIFDENCSTNASEGFTYPRRVLPVDLNVYLCKAFKIMSNFYEKINDHHNSTFYKGKYEHWVKSIQKILYSPADGIWFDYDIGQHRKRPYFYPTNFSPLWAEIFDKRLAPKMGKKALGSVTLRDLQFATGFEQSKNISHFNSDQARNNIFRFQNETPSYFKKMNLMPFRGSSNEPPKPENDLMKMFMAFKHMIAMGLYNSGDEEAQDYAREFIRRWVKQSIECECCKYDLYDDVDLRSVEFRWGCGWVVLTSLDLINTFFVNSDFAF